MDKRLIPARVGDALADVDTPALIVDLVPVPGPPGLLPATTDTAAIEARAVSAYESDRREAAWGFVSASIICWVIWGVTSGGFPWPVFVMLGTGLNLLRLLVMRRSEIETRRERLERKAERKAIEEHRRGELEPGSDDGS